MSVGPVTAPGAAQLVGSITAAMDAALNAMLDEAATPAAPPVVSPEPSAPVGSPSPPPATPQAAAAAMASEAVLTQASLAPLLADLAAVQAAATLPPAAQAMAQRILATHAPIDDTVTAETLRAAVGASGVFLEAGLAASLAAAPDAAAPDLTGDLKGQLLQLAVNLGAAGQSRAASPQTPQPTRAPTPARASPERPPPPSRDGPTIGQSAARSRLGAETRQEEEAPVLRQDVQGALSRLELMQYASLHRAGADTRWTFELPVGAREAPSIAQFEISREGHGPGEAGEPVWRARFSLDVEPSGPVHAEVSLSGGRTRVTLWAERDGARAAMSLREGELATALSAEDGAPAAVRVLAGAPHAPAPDPGQFLDRTS